MSETRTVLLTAGFGNQAKLLIPRLVRAGFQVYAVRAHQSEPGPESLGAAKVFVGDACDAIFLTEALTGVDAFYHIGPTAHPKEFEMGLAAIEAAKAANIEHFIFSSVLHPIASGLMQHAVKRDIEEAIIQSGLNFTILQPSDYMQTGIQERHISQGVFDLPWDLNRRQALIDLKDVADAVVQVLFGGKMHYGGTYELSSGDCFTAYEITAVIGAALSRTMRTQQISPDEIITHFFGDANNQEVRYQIEVFRKICEWYDKYDFVGNDFTLRNLLQREPTSVYDYVLRNFGHISAKD